MFNYFEICYISLSLCISLSMIFYCCFFLNCPFYYPVTAYLTIHAPQDYPKELASFALTRDVRPSGPFRS